jgi:hypothetical protein
MQAHDSTSGNVGAASEGNLDFCTKVESTLQKKGKTPLNDAELLLLACDALSRTFTYDEKDYR